MKKDGIEGYNLLLKNLTKRTNIPEKKLRKICEALSESIKETLIDSNVKQITIPGLGSFLFSEYQSRNYVLPNGVEVSYPMTIKPRFKFSIKTNNEIKNKKFNKEEEE